MALARPLRTDPVYLRTIRPLEFAMVDGVADHRLLSWGAACRHDLQARFLLQVRLPDRAVQLRRLNNLTSCSKHYIITVWGLLNF